MNKAETISPLTIVPAGTPAPVVALSTGKVSPEKALQVLNGNGMAVSKQQAEVVLDFLYTFAQMTTP